MKHLYLFLMTLLASISLALLAGCGGGGGGGGGGAAGGGGGGSLLVTEGADYGGSLAPDETEFVVLEFNVKSNAFGLAVDQVVLQALGTGNDANVLVYLYRDADGSGTLNKDLGIGESDRLVEGPVTFTGDNGTATININPFETLTNGGTAKFFVVYVLPTFPAGGASYGAELVSVSGNKGGTPVNTNMPNPIVTGEGAPEDLVTFTETLLVSAGSLSLPNITVNNNAADVPMLHFKLFTNRAGGVTVNDITLTTALTNGAAANGDDFVDNSVGLFLDANNDGNPEGGALAIGSVTGATLTFPGVNYALASGVNRSFLVIASAANTVVKNGRARFSLADAAALTLSAAVPVSGAPLSGRQITFNNTVLVALDGSSPMQDTDVAQVLDASDSEDPDDGDAIVSYAFSIANPGSVPGDVSIVQDIDNPALAVLSIVNTRSGNYTVQARVTVTSSDGSSNSATLPILVNVQNDAPTAVLEILGDTIVPKEKEVPVTGIGSFDPDVDDTLSYAWTLSTNPGGVGVTFKDSGTTMSTLANPIIETVVAGFDYTVFVDLVVSDVGGLMDAAPQESVFVFNQVSVLEFTTDGNRANEFQNTVNLQVILHNDPPNPLAGPVTANVYVLPSSTATEGDDIEPVVGFVSFLAGANDGDTQPVTISINDDAHLEGMETIDLSLELQSGAGALIGPRRVYRLQIQDNDDQDLMGSETAADALMVLDPDSGFTTRRSPWNMGKFPKVTASAYNPAEDRLYAYDITTKEVLVINTITGAAAPLGAPGFESITGMTYDTVSDQLLAVDRVTRQLVRISTTTGVGIAVGTLGGAFTNLQALAHDGNADILYASDLATNQILVVNKNTGVASPLGGVLGANFAFVQGLAFDTSTNTLYGADRITDVLCVIDTTTGDAVKVGNLGVGNTESLTYDANNDLLYGTDSFRDLLFTADTDTGLAETVGSTGLRNVRGLCYDPNTDTLFGYETTSTKLIVINTETGQPRPIGRVGLPDARSVAYDFMNDKIYALDRFFRELHEIDPETGASVLVGVVPFTGIRSMTYNPTDGLLYAVDVDLDALVTINPANAATNQLVVAGLNAFGFVSTVEYVNDGADEFIYGVDTNTDLLFQIDLGTMTAVAVGDTLVSNLEGMAWTEGDNPGGAGTMYAVDSDTDELVTLDLTTGRATTVNTFGRTEVRALTYDKNQDIIYGVDIFTDVLLRIEPFSGTSTVINRLTDGANPLSNVQAIAFDSIANVFWVCDTGSNLTPILYTLDPVTGVGTNISNVPVNNAEGFLWLDDDTDGFFDRGVLIEEFFNFTITDMAIDPNQQTLYGVTLTGLFFTINKTTGEVFIVEDLASAYGLVQPEGLAYNPEFPEPKMFVNDIGTDRLYSIDLERIGLFEDALTELGRNFYGSVRALVIKD